MNVKLTLRLDEELIRLAKSYAKETGKSVSQLVADYFSLLQRPQEEAEVHMTPVVRSLKGLLRECDIGEFDYREYLKEKHL